MSATRRSMRATRAAVTPPGAPEGLMYFVASTAQRDRHGTIIEPEGWEFAEFDANPVFLINHDSEQLPAGRIPYREVITDAAFWRSVGREDIGAGLVIGVEWDEEDPDPVVQRARSKYERGFMTSVSVAFEPRGYDKKTKTYTRQGLLEVSGVTLPSNTQAVKLDAPGGDELERELAAEAAAWLEARGIEVRWPTTRNELYARVITTRSDEGERQHILSVLRVTLDIPEDARVLEVDPDGAWKWISHPNAGESVERKQLSVHPPITWQHYDRFWDEWWTDGWVTREVEADVDDADALAPGSGQDYSIEEVGDEVISLDLERCAPLTPALSREVTFGALRWLGRQRPATDGDEAPVITAGARVLATSGLSAEMVRGVVEAIEGQTATVRLSIDGQTYTTTRALDELRLDADEAPADTTTERAVVLRVTL